MVIFFLIFISDLFDNLVSISKLLVDTSLFLVARDITLSAKNLKDDLKKINKLAFQSKVIFNVSSKKQAQKVIFSGNFITQPIFD